MGVGQFDERLRTGRGYTDVHARMPALTILFFLSMAAALILLANVRLAGGRCPGPVGCALRGPRDRVLYPTICRPLGQPESGLAGKAVIQRKSRPPRRLRLDKVKYKNFGFHHDTPSHDHRGHRDPEQHPAVGPGVHIRCHGDAPSVHSRVLHVLNARVDRYS